MAARASQMSYGMQTTSISGGLVLVISGLRCEYVNLHTHLEEGFPGSTEICIHEVDLEVIVEVSDRFRLSLKLTQSGTLSVFFQT